MGDVKVAEYRNDVLDILRGSDLSLVSAKSVRDQLELKHSTEFKQSKNELKELIRDCFDQVQKEKGMTSNAAPAKRERKRKEPANGVKPKKTKRKAKDGQPKEPRKVNPNNGFNRPMVISGALKDLLETNRLSRPHVVQTLWKYIRSHELQDADDKRFIKCDEKMKAVFETDRIHMFTMSKIIGKYLSPLPEDELKEWEAQNNAKQEADAIAAANAAAAANTPIPIPSDAAVAEAA